MVACQDWNQKRKNVMRKPHSRIDRTILQDLGLSDAWQRHRTLKFKVMAALLGATSTGCWLSLAAQSAPRDPVFSIPDGTVLPGPRQLAISVPYNGEVRFTTDGTNPGPSSTLYSGRPLMISWTQQVRAIAIVGASSSNIVSATYTLNSNKYAPPSSGGNVPPVIILQQPTPTQ
jgi:hypothetical protein